MTQGQSQGYQGQQGQPPGQQADAGVSPLRLFGRMLKLFRNRAGLTSDDLGARVYLSGSAIRKIETGRQAPTDALVTAFEAIPELGCEGVLRVLFTTWPSS